MWRNGLTQTLTASQTEAVTADPLGLLSFQAWRFLLVPCGLFKIWPEVLICNLLRALWTSINTDKYKTTHFKMLFPLFCWFPSSGYSISKELWSHSLLPLHGQDFILALPIRKTPERLRAAPYELQTVRLQRRRREMVQGQETWEVSISRQWWPPFLWPTPPLKVKWKY